MAYQSFVVFESRNVVPIYFTRNQCKPFVEVRKSTYIDFNQEKIKAKLEVKIFGVLLDQRLGSKSSIILIAKSRIQVVLVLKELKCVKLEVTY